MTLTGLHSERYLTTRELGRGGEGAVYELSSHSGLVVKLYNEILTADKIAKLQLMIAMRSPAIEAYAAWPVDLVRNDTGFFCGFIMKKLSGFVPLHMVFSPMDRKKMFPDKGYNFLVHVARNLATAFFNLHEAGLVVGDVNEGNILISSSGIIAFIDCDSFQVSSGAGYYYCEVGVPRYTPPELLKKASFEHTVRTTNTDSFSMAILIFQLLFLGRHPFAGRNKATGDIDEETAIRNQYFAYSLDNKKNRLSPPNDSLSITTLSDELVILFHHAFQYDLRPLPAAWTKALDAFLGDMVTCGNSRLHTYPGKLQECPWCAFRKARGIMFFLDDSYLRASAVLGDIESFVNGFRLDKLELKKWNNATPRTTPAPLPVAKQWVKYNKLSTYTAIGLCLVAALITPLYGRYHLLFFNTPLFLIAPLLLVAAYITFKSSPWRKKLKAELERRKQAYYVLDNRYGSMIDEYNNPRDLTIYTRALDTLQQLVHDFRRLPDEFERRRKKMEEELYNEQLNEYLRQFRIESHAIPSFGPAKKNALSDHNIRTAADIIKLHAVRVPGIGPANQQVLFDWCRQMASGFVYIPNDYQVKQRLERVNEEVSRIKLQLESAIRSEYQSLNFLKLNIANRANILETQIRDVEQKAMQAKADMEAFWKLAA